MHSVIKETTVNLGVYCGSSRIIKSREYSLVVFLRKVLFTITLRRELCVRACISGECPSRACFRSYRTMVYK